MNKIRWGVLSTARIAREKVIPAMMNTKHCKIVAIASRSLEKAQITASQFGIPNAYGSYDELLADTTIEAVYIPLPNHLHIPWSIQALKHGKHVLCEKPIAINTNEIQELAIAGKKHPELKIMEAFMYRFHPQWDHIIELISKKEIGEVKMINSFISYYNVDPNNIRNIALFGGGSLMDIGCYLISLSRLIFNGEPHRIFAHMDYDPHFKTDRLVSGILDFYQGLSIVTCSTQLARYQNVTILGDKGWIRVDIPFNVPSNEPTRVFHQRKNKIYEIIIDPCDQYAIQVDSFSQAILRDTNVPIPINDSLNNMKVIDTILKSAKKEKWLYLS